MGMLLSFCFGQVVFTEKKSASNINEKEGRLNMKTCQVTSKKKVYCNISCYVTFWIHSTVISCSLSVAHCC